MKTLIALQSFCVSLSVLCISTSVSAGTASSIAELHTLFQADRCILCHDDVAPYWLGSSHSKTLLNPSVLNDIGVKFNESGDSKRTIVRECFSCHAPQIQNASDALIDTIASIISSAAGIRGRTTYEELSDELLTLNINCRVCHMLKGMPEAEVQENVIYGPGWDEHEQSHMNDFNFDTLQSTYLTSPEFCRSCHGNCTSERSIKTRVTCLKQSTSNTESKICGECHMTLNHSFKGNQE